MPWLTGWRGLSIIAVLAGHFTGDHLVAWGPFGVEMFFVLSARLMADMLFVERVALGEFIRRRVARTVPAMLLFVAVICAVLSVVPPVKFMVVTPRQALLAVFTLYNYAAAAGDRAPPIDQLWSLCVEFHSYLLLALLAVAVRRWRWAPRPILLGGAMLAVADGIVSNGLLRQDFGQSYWRTDCHISTKFLSAWMRLDLRESGARPPPWVAPACFAVGVAAFNLRAPGFVWVTVGGTALAIAVNALDHTWDRLKIALSGRGLGRVGTMSYSIFLWQQPFCILVMWHWQAGLAGALACLPLILACAALSFRFEDWARRAINRLDLAQIRAAIAGARPAWRTPAT